MFVCDSLTGRLLAVVVILQCSRSLTLNSNTLSPHPFRPFKSRKLTNLKEGVYVACTRCSCTVVSHVVYGRCSSAKSSDSLLTTLGLWPSRRSHNLGAPNRYSYYHWGHWRVSKDCIPPNAKRYWDLTSPATSCSPLPSS